MNLLSQQNFARWAALLTVLMLAACAGRPVHLADHLPANAGAVEVESTPFIAQDEFQCGPASLAMLLQESGVEVDEQALRPRVYVPKLKGSLQAEMVAATRDYDRMTYRIAPTLPALLAELELGRPVLVLKNLGWNSYPLWHYAVVIGYSPAQDSLILRSGTTRRKLQTTADFMDDWRKADSWGIVALLPGTLPAGPSARRYLQAAAGLEAAGKTMPALLAYRSATAQWPKEPAGWLGRGNTEYAQENYRAAEQAYQAALLLAPGNVVVSNNLAQVLGKLGCKAKAQTEIEQALAKAPPDLRPALTETQQEIDAMPNTGAACPL